MPFGKLMLDSLDDMQERGVSVFDRALMLSLIGMAKYGGLIYASQREIADYAGTYPANVNQAIKRLVVYGYLHKEKDCLRIDPLFCQFGKGAE